MPKLHTGEESRPGDILGFNPGKYPRKDDKGNKLEGHGMYVLEGEELADYKAKVRESDLTRPTEERNKAKQAVLDLRRQLMGTPYEQLEFLGLYGIEAFRNKYLDIVFRVPFPDGIIDDTTLNPPTIAPPRSVPLMSVPTQNSKGIPNG